jgi:hypothetical protein
MKCKTQREQSLEVCERHLQMQLERLRLELGAVRDATWRLGICPENRIWPQAIEEFIDTGVMPYGERLTNTETRRSRAMQGRTSR